MTEEARTAFREELGGWELAAPLEQNHGQWFRDRVYARGKLVASRSIYRAGDVDRSSGGGVIVVIDGGWWAGEVNVDCGAQGAHSCPAA